MKINGSTSMITKIALIKTKLLFKKSLNDAVVPNRALSVWQTGLISFIATRGCSHLH